MIEYLTQEIIEESLDFAQKSHVDSAWRDHKFDREVLRTNLLKMIDSPNYFTCVYRKDGVIVGYWFAVLGKFFFSNVTLGMECGIYIDKEHRGGRVAIKMYEAFISWCALKGVEPLVSIYFGEDENNEKTYNFFRKTGMIECGRVYRSK